MTPEELQEFMTQRGTFGTYAATCQKYQVTIQPLLKQACLATRACEDSNSQRFSHGDRLATAVGFLKTITVDALTDAVRAAGDQMPNLSL